MNYFMGCDLARKNDWSVAVVIDGDGRVVWMDRFHQISWSLQVERIALLYKKVHCQKCFADASGLGDVVVEALQERGLDIEPFVFTIPSRRALIEELILTFDHAEIRIPDTEKFQVMRSELESMEYVMDGATIRYSAPPHANDDCVMALALAVHAWHGARSAVWGVIGLLQRQAEQISKGVRDFFGELIHPKPAPKPVLVASPKVVIRTEAPAKKANDPCPNCKSTSTILMSGGIGRLILHCNSCAADDGQLPAQPAGQCCSNYLPQIIGNATRCGNCGWQSDQNKVIAGVRFSDLQRSGRFGWRRAG